MARPGTENESIGRRIIIPADPISCSLLMWSRLRRAGRVRIIMAAGRKREGRQIER